MHQLKEELRIRCRSVHSCSSHAGQHLVGHQPDRALPHHLPQIDLLDVALDRPV
jgi:hypothetical protein